MKRQDDFFCRNIGKNAKKINVKKGLGIPIDELIK